NPVGQTAHQLERHETATRVPDHINPCWISDLAPNQFIDELRDEANVIEGVSLPLYRFLRWTSVIPATLHRFRVDGNKVPAISGSVDWCLGMVFPICRARSMKNDHQGPRGTFITGRPMHEVMPSSSLMLDRKFVSGTHGLR